MEEKEKDPEVEEEEEQLETVHIYVRGDKYHLGKDQVPLIRKVNEYLDWDQNDVTRNELISIGERRDIPTLTTMLLSRLEFGTAGIRGRMAAGYSNMNDLVIIQTSQGLVSYLKKLKPLADMKQCVVIGYDGRHNSRRFAELTAVAALSQGFKVYLFSRICPTPFIPFTVSYLPVANEENTTDYYGVMITASHNPKEDNGYKVYWQNGAQIVSPHDKKIQEHILDNLKPWDGAWETEGLAEKCVDPYEVVSKGYYEAITRDLYSPDINSETKLRFTYTPMHGVGQEYMTQAFKAAGFKPFVSVESQRLPDPEFPTVRFPNPEEGKSALNHAIATANKAGTPIILANDPDADRLAVAEKNKSTGEWRVFNGNELGALLGWWMMYTHKKGNSKIPIENCYMIASTVSSKILESMAKKEGFTFYETLTGFKWMGNKAYDLTRWSGNVKVLFAFEEAIGFMVSPAVLDKDGITAGIKLAELAAFLDQEGLTLADQLNKIYETYGYHVSENSYFICRNPDIIAQIFRRLRHWGREDQRGNASYPESILNGKYKITAVRDLTTGYDSSQPNNQAILPVSQSSQMITFTFENGLTLTLRTSGTEPKIKYYSELRTPPEEKDWTKVVATLHEMVQGIVEEFIQPSVYALEPKAD